jgi:hypothetical protein
MMSRYSSASTGGPPSMGLPTHRPDKLMDDIVALRNLVSRGSKSSSNLFKILPRKHNLLLMIEVGPHGYILSHIMIITEYFHEISFIYYYTLILIYCYLLFGYFQG